MALGFLSDNLLAQLVEQAGGYAVGGAAQKLVDPLLQPEANAAWALAPSLPLDPATLASLVRQDRLDLEGAAGWAAQTGLDRDPFTRLVAAGRTPPGLGDAFELYRRGKLDEAGLRVLLLRGGADERYLDELLHLIPNLPSVADLAMWRQQEFIGDQELHDRAAVAGFTASDADLYFRAAGLPPGIETGLELLRRGKIDEARFAEYVAEGHTKTKYTPDLLELVYQPLSASTAAMLLIRERITEAEAVKIGEENGLDRESFLAWSKGLGRPIAPGEALTIINRGLKGDPAGAEARAYFREVVARSDTRTEYADDLLELRIHYPSLFQITRALGNGGVTAQLATETLRKEGYTEEWVRAIVASASGSAAHKAKTVTSSIVDALYEAGLESHPEAVAALERLGYTAEDAGLLLEVWSARRVVSELIHALSMVRSRYTGWKIDKPAAQAIVDSLTLDGAVKDRLFPLWDQEREANAPILTRAQVAEALKVGRYTLDQALEAWQRLGYTAEDATTLAWVEAKGDPNPPAAA